MASKAKKKNPYVKTVNARMGIVTPRSRMRHIATGTKYPQPLCGTTAGYYSGWTASASPKTHKLPICGKCISTIEKLHNDLTTDPAWIAQNTDPDEMMKAAKEDFLSLLEEYGDVR